MSWENAMGDSVAMPGEGKRIARLLDVDGEMGWSAADAAVALRHQLTVALLPDLAAAPGARQGELEEFVRRHSAINPEVPQSFLGQLTCAAPAEELLVGIKEWSRHVRDDQSSPLSREPATVLYYAAIAAAMVRLNRKISRLTDEQLREGFTWARDVSGAEGLGRLFDEGERAVGGIMRG